VEVIPTETTRSTPNAFGDPETHPNHGNLLIQHGEHHAYTVN
jgi:hypothetical protein